MLRDRLSMSISCQGFIIENPPKYFMPVNLIYLRKTCVIYSFRSDILTIINRKRKIY